MTYPVKPLGRGPAGASIPVGWEIIEDANGNAVYVRVRK